MSTKSKSSKTVLTDKSVRFIYLGPNLLSYGLQKYSVFIGGLPEIQAAKAFEKFPLIKQLFVNPAKISEVEKAILTKGTPQNEAYKQITERSK